MKTAYFDDSELAIEVAECIRTFYPEREVTVVEQECEDPDGNSERKILVKW